MEQVVMNLAVNARDAMPEGGSLLIETGNTTVTTGTEENNLHIGGMRAGEYVMLRVCDTGVGMSKEVKQRIFDPFFTTKEKGKGTGWDYPWYNGIIKQSEGEISINSEEGKGTTFTILLPRAYGSPTQPGHERKYDGRLPRGTETVLVVEDEEMLRNLTVSFLKPTGIHGAGGYGRRRCAADG
jgi:nitrogen-specific signal transduction histidine kinase